MRRELEPHEQAERSIIKKYRRELWGPFIAALKRYSLIESGDKIAVCISGGKDSMLLSKLMQLLERVSDVPFGLEFIVMDPGYNPENRRRIEENAELLRVPIKIFATDVFKVANNTEKNPCYLCARMRRGYLYRFAKDLGCNKIALGHHQSDVVETTLLGMFYGGQLQGMMPKLRSRNFPGMELIRPMYCIREEDVLSWRRYNNLEFIGCACRFTESAARDTGRSKRQEIKELLLELQKQDPDIEKRIFNSIHSVCLDTFPGYIQGGEEHSFLERYGKNQGDA